MIVRGKAEASKKKKMLMQRLVVVVVAAAAVIYYYEKRIESVGSLVVVAMSECQRQRQRFYYIAWSEGCV